MSDINLKNLVNHHNNSGKKATLTAVRPPGRFGALEFERGKIISFKEKPDGDGSWINGGFFVLEPDFYNYIDDDNVMLEREPINKVTNDKQLVAYRHNGFWQCMDTLRDKNTLENFWIKNNAPWKVW